ncbi:hypothetical protein FGO68_gene3195 [Halteria grandinella]|uniref:Uncharacterized protein n=1 Tax=Halteria grandinella TaxID=5974 RepID=A0A8J8NS59_HALGN|nr:hypothetical protein FGO68_gene3195 [Halteria grandinella]
METNDDEQPQSKAQQQNISYQENLELCSCGSQESVMFYCQDQACPFYKKQKIYCIECMVPEKHDHRPVILAKKAKNVADEWSKLIIEVSMLRNTCNQWMKNNEPLVEFLDIHITMPDQKLLLKMMQVEELCIHLDQFYQQFVVENSAKGDIMKLEQLKPDLLAFKQRLQPLQFLKNIGPAIFWKVYSEVIRQVNLRCT